MLVRALEVFVGIARVVTTMEILMILEGIYGVTVCGLRRRRHLHRVMAIELKSLTIECDCEHLRFAVLPS